MKTHLILTEDWESMKEAVKTAEDYLKVFNVKITTERKNVDVSQEYLYDVENSWSWLTLTKTKSLKAGFIFGLPSQQKAIESDCVGIVCDKKKTLEDSNLYGQQATLGVKQIIEVYCIENKKKAYGMEYNAYTLVHELFHALADHYKVEDTLHEYLTKNKISLNEYRDILLGRIIQNDLGLLPVVYTKAMQVVDYATSIGTPIRITEGYRSPERQNQLFNQKPKVTNARAWESMHQYRVAFDIVFRKEGYNATNQQWKAIADYAKKLGFDWGGDWKKFIDKPHFELTFGKTLKDFQNNNIDWQKYFKTDKYIFTRDLEFGMSGDDVREWQNFLKAQGHFDKNIESTGYYGEHTRQATEAFQIKHQVASLYELLIVKGKRVGKKTRDFVNNM